MILTFIIRNQQFFFCSCIFLLLIQHLQPAVNSSHHQSAPPPGFCAIAKNGERLILNRRKFFKGSLHHDLFNFHLLFIECFLKFSNKPELNEVIILLISNYQPFYHYCIIRFPDLQLISAIGNIFIKAGCLRSIATAMVYLLRHNHLSYAVY